MISILLRSLPELKSGWFACKVVNMGATAKLEVLTEQDISDVVMDLNDEDQDETI